MMAGDTLFAEVAFPAVLSALKENFPIKIISGGTDGASSVWVTRPGEKIEKPEDLKGKRFVYSRPKSVSESTILAVLKSHGIKPSEVTMVAIGDFGAGLTALEHNKIDIAIIPEPIFSQKMKAGAKYQIIPWLDSKVPPYTQTVGITTNEMIATKGDKLRAVIEGRRKGVDLIYADQKAAAASLAKGYNLPPDIAASALAGLLKQAPHWFSRGDLKLKLMDLTAKSLIENGALSGAVDWKAAIDDRFIPKDLQTKTQ
jgi:NitT/TauT family transport system substrate-binding protein